MIMTDYWQSKKVDFGTIKEMVLGFWISGYNGATNVEVRASCGCT
jgi:hypothetical protein